MALKEDLDAVVAQLGKAKTEILGKLDSLAQTIVSLQAQVAADSQAATELADAAQTVADLKVSAQSLDDVVPDEVPPPSPEPTP